MLPATAATFQSVRPHQMVDLRWLVGFGSDSGDAAFYDRVNQMINSLPTGSYWLFMADDAALDVDLLSHWMEAPADCCMWLFGQSRTAYSRGINRDLIPTPELLLAGGDLDNGQAIISVDAFRSLGVEYHSLGWERYMFAHIAKNCALPVHYETALRTHHDTIYRRTAP